MKEMIMYKNLQRTHTAIIVGVDVGSDVEMLEKITENIRREIVDIAECLGLYMNDMDGLTGLAGLLVYNKSTSYQKSVKYLGLYKAKGRDGRKMKKYNHKAQRYLTILTNAILRKNGETSAPRYRDLRKILKVVIEAKKQIGLAERGAGV